MLEPLRVENRVPPLTASRLSRPGMPPIHLSRASRVRTASPERNMISPMRMNKSTGASTKLASVAKALVTMSRSAGKPPMKK